MTGKEATNISVAAHLHQRRSLSPFHSSSFINIIHTRIINHTAQLTPRHSSLIILAHNFPIHLKYPQFPLHRTKMKSITLAALAAVAALCQADSFASPVPWFTNGFTLYEPEMRAPGIGGV
jgi:hypothetical protein